MLVTVVRSKANGIVQLPEGVNIRPLNFVEIKTLSSEMKKAIVILEKAGTIDVAQVADLSGEMMEGSIDNKLPSDTTGSMAALFVTDRAAKAQRERLKNIPDILTDYSKAHAVSEEEMEEHKAQEEAKAEKAEEARQARKEKEERDKDDDNHSVGVQDGLPLTVEDATEKLGEKEVEKLEKSVDELDEDVEYEEDDATDVSVAAYQAVATKPATATPVPA